LDQVAEVGLAGGFVKDWLVCEAAVIVGVELGVRVSSVEVLGCGLVDTYRGFVEILF
jgi:hypothetical protein